MLVIVVVGVLTQLPSHPPPPGRAPRVTLERAIPTLVDPRSSWRLRSEAVSALTSSPDDLTEAELALLERAWARLPHTPGRDCKPGDVRTCGEPPERCLSPAGFVLAAAVPRHQSRERFVAVAAQLLESRTEPALLHYARAIVAFNDQPARQPEARRLLASPEAECVREAAGMLERLEHWEPTTVQALEEVVARGAPAARYLGRLVGRRSEPWAEALAERLLNHLDGDYRGGLVDAALADFPRSARLRAVLARVAACDPSPRNVNDARRAFGVAKVPLPDVSCPVPRWSVNGRTVTGPTSVTLTDSSTVAPPLPGCERQRGFALGTVGRHCILGVGGELSGALFGWTGSGVPVELVPRRDGLSPIALLSRGEDVLVVSALPHHLGSGALARLTRNAGTTFEYELLGWLDGVPVAWGTDGTNVFVTLRERDSVGACLEQTLVLEPDGSTSVAAGASPCVR